MSKNRRLAFGRKLVLLLSLVALGQGGPPASAADRQIIALPFKGLACCTLHYDKDWISGYTTSWWMSTPLRRIPLFRRMCRLPSTKVA